MADITMCATNGCPLELICYRMQATPSHWQSMSAFEFTASSTGAECEHLIPLRRAPGKADKKDA